MHPVRGRFGIPAALVAVLVLAVGSAAGCSSSGSSGGGGTGGGGTGSGGSGALKDTLKNIHGSVPSAGSFEYGDTARVVKLNGGADPATNGPYTMLLGFGSAQLAEWDTALPPLTGFDPLTATRAISVGNPPNGVSVLYGSFDPAAVGAKLAAWGYHKEDRGDGVTAWVFQDDHKIDLSKVDPATDIGPGMGGWLNVVWVSKSRIAYGRATSDLTAALTGSAKPLSDDATVGALADCLGSPLAAEMIKDPKLAQSGVASAVAFGVVGTGAADLREEICATAPDDAGARALAAAFTKAVGSGFDHRTNQPWSALLSDPQPAVLGGPAHVVRLTAKPVGPRVQLIFDLAAQEDYLPLLGQPDGAKSPAGGSATLPSTAAGTDAGSDTPTDAGSDTPNGSGSDTPTDAGSDTASPSSS